MNKGQMNDAKRRALNLFEDYYDLLTRADALAEAVETLRKEMQMPENRGRMTLLQNCASLDEWIRRVIDPALAAYREE